MNKTKKITIRVTPELKDALKQQADEEMRTLSGYIEYVLKNTILFKKNKKK
jgi:hypothetical protein